VKTFSARAPIFILAAVAMVLAGVILWGQFPIGQTNPNESADARPAGQQASGKNSPLRITGSIEYTVRDAGGNVKEQGATHNTVNDPEAINEVFNRITGAASGGAYDGIAALSVPFNGSGSDDPSDGVAAASITLNLDGDSGSSGVQNPADGAVATDFGNESGNGTVVVTFTALADSVEIKQVVLTKAAEDKTDVGGAADIADADIFAYLDVADVTLNISDTVQYTWTVDVD